MKKKPNRSSSTNPRLQKDLLLGLEQLRAEAKEISRLYVANIQRDMVQLIDYVNDTSIQPARGSRSESLATIKKALETINVKPDKGRRKDLRRIERAIAEMMKCVSTS